MLEQVGAFLEKERKVGTKFIFDKHGVKQQIRVARISIAAMNNLVSSVRERVGRDGVCIWKPKCTDCPQMATGSLALCDLSSAMGFHRAAYDAQRIVNSYIVDQLDTGPQRPVICPKYHGLGRAERLQISG